jgi:hypothetical protein
MPRKPRTRRPFEKVMDEFAEELTPWDLDEHLHGCLAGYQAAPSYGASVYFALEALWGIARDVGIQAKEGKYDPAQLDADWTIAPRANLAVQWIWIRSLATAWEKYKSERVPLGEAFGLEGGQGRRPVDDTLTQLLDERAIARWIWSRVLAAREANKKIRIEDVVQEASEHFYKSDETIRRAWKRFGRFERLRTTDRVTTSPKSRPSANS